MNNPRRTHLMLDWKVQGALVVRVVGYWLYCLLTVSMLVFCWTLFQEQPSSSSMLFARVWQKCGVAMASSVAILPLVIIDALRMSHRFVGPAMRIRRGLQEIAAGRTPRQLELRKGDFWFEFAEDFNRAVEKLSSVAPAAAVESAADASACESTSTRESAATAVVPASPAARKDGQPVGVDEDLNVRA